MKARVLLPYLQYNENFDHAQSRSESGQLICNVSYQHIRQGEQYKKSIYQQLLNIYNYLTAWYNSFRMNIQNINVLKNF